MAVDGDEGNKARKTAWIPGAVASHSKCASGVYLVRGSVRRPHLREYTNCGLPWSSERSSPAFRHRRWRTVGRTGSRCCIRTTSEEARQYWSSRLRTGEGGEHSYRVRNAQGDYRWFLTRFEPLRASDGTLLLRIGATLDIDELTRARGGAAW